MRKPADGGSGGVAHSDLASKFASALVGDGERAGSPGHHHDGVAPAMPPPARKAALLDGLRNTVQLYEGEARRDRAHGRVMAPGKSMDNARSNGQDMQSLLDGWNPAAAAGQIERRRSKRSAAVTAMYGVKHALEMMGEYNFSPGQKKPPAAKGAMPGIPIPAVAAPDAPPAPNSLAQDAADDAAVRDATQSTPGRPRRAAAEAAMARTAAFGAELVGPAYPPRRAYATGNIAQVPPDMFAQMQEMFRESGDKRWGLRRILRSGLLDGLEVEYRTCREPLRGVFSDTGLIRCFCSACQGENRITPGVFEEHANSTIRRPTEGIFLLKYEMSLREFCYQAATDSVPDRRSSPGMGKHLTPAPGPSARERVTPRAQPPPAGTPRTRELPPRPGRFGAVTEPEQDAPPAPPEPPAPPKPPPSGRVIMMAPTGPSTGARHATALRNKNKNKRLFIAGSGSALVNGEQVTYMHSHSQNIALITGTIVIDPHGISGILCHHCNEVISASMFESHAGRASRRAPYEFIVTSTGENLKSIAARMPDDVEYDSAAFAYGSIGTSRRRQLTALRTSQGIGADADVEAEVVGGCCICQETDFTKDGFDDRTIIICDQCELEHHVGCLRSSGRCHLEALPDGDWFCSSGCEKVHSVLTAQVKLGPVEVQGDTRNLVWQLLHKDMEGSSHADLAAVQDILQQSFDPIIDMITRTDLLPVMVASGNYGEWDYAGMYSLLLRMEGRPVAAAICRVFGTRVAELPLIATTTDCRRQGLCRVLLDALLSILSAAGVDRISLPAAKQTVVTWRSGFGFQPIPEGDVEWATTELRMLRFPGTDMLQRPVVPGAELPPLRPQGWQRGAKAAAAKEGADKAAAASPAEGDAAPGEHEAAQGDQAAGSDAPDGNPKEDEPQAKRLRTGA
eukprot:jgi/Tetstr1/461217/TSEL_006354.t1